ncbi:cyclin-A1-4-like [Senna tora]|uniref:B-like cyclin n=1 Tax=Senna tora TaxID=362788 RepID=A0A834T9P2_9FABA|nr:cyclin-A1-4-like [Senna tora]
MQLHPLAVSCFCEDLSETKNLTNLKTASKSGFSITTQDRMFSRHRHGSSPSSSQEKRTSVSENFSKKVTAVKNHLTKKTSALADVTNQRNISLNGIRTSNSAPSKPMVPCVSKIAKTKKESITSPQKKNTSRESSQASVKSSVLLLPKDTSSTRSSQLKAGVEVFLDSSTIRSICPAFTSIVYASRMTDISPSKSFNESVSLDESMSVCDSLNSPEFEYIDHEDTISLKSIESKTERTCDSKVVDIDKNFKDPQVCPSIAHEIYQYLRVSEGYKRPSMDFMEKIQKDVNSSMRAILIDWLVEVAEEYRFLPDTLFLTVNYLDRYLSGNKINRKHLQLLGVACMMIAAKYEEICPPKVEEFCYVTDNTYSRNQVLQMESDVLRFLKFEMTVPTARCFLRRFIIAARQTCKVPKMQLEYLADYLAELSLLEYSMLQYTPSLIAASATFLAQFILLPRKKPWNSTLRHYTSYQSWDLCDCVNALHWLCCHGSYNLPAIREKYSQHKMYTLTKFAYIVPHNYVADDLCS